jgi:flagellar assembly protein FliH
LSEPTRTASGAPVRAWSAPELGATNAQKATAPLDQTRPTAETTAAALRQMADMADAREIARKQGFAQGMTEGLEAAAQQVADEVATAQARLATLACSVTDSIHASENEIAEELLDLAISLAQAMTRSVFNTKRESIKPIVNACIAAIPGVGEVEVHVHPDDIPFLANDAGTARQIAYLPDATMSRGECYVSTATNAVDGRHRTRWAELMAPLSNAQEWVGNE